MRPHRLALTAFGPFADHVEVDFDRLGQGGLFLMHGETGAGKTSVLDGLSFALYGRLPGVRGVNRLRSDHAAAGVRTRVRLDVSIGGRRLRITRTPAQERPKLRGQGATVEPASVTLDEWDDSVAGGWRSCSTRVGEVDAELSDLLGMSAEQFHQVVLLPQGQFAKFLHSDAGERTQLLQRLFGTDRFRRIEEWLAEQRRQTRESLEDARHGVRRLVARIAQVGGEPEPDDIPEPAWVADLAAEAAAAAQAASMDAEAARQGHELAQRAVSEAADLRRRQQRRKGALERQGVLLADAPRLAAAVAEIEAARRAGGVSEALQDEVRRARDAKLALAGLASACGRLPETLRAAPIGALRAAADEGRETLGRLTEAAELERSVLAAVGEQAQASRAVEADRRRVAELAPLQAEAPAARAALEQRVAVARAAAVALPKAQASAERAVEAVAAARLRAARAADTARLSSEHLEAREVAVQLGEALAELRTARIDGMIAELAAALTDEAPCPVCGALDHPDPSEVRGRQVSRADEEAAAAAVEVARDAAVALGEQLAAAVAAGDAALSQLRRLGREDVALGDLLAEQEAGATAVDELDAQAAALATAEAESVRLDEVEAQRRDELVRLEASLAAAQERMQAAGARQAQLAARLGALLGDAPDVAHARRRTLELVDAVEAAEAAAATAERARLEWAEAGRRAEQAAEAARFSSVEEARAALRAPAALQELESDVDRARKEEAAVAELLADPELDVALSPAAPVEAATAQAREALIASRQAEQRVATAAQRAEQLRQLQGQLADRLAGLEPLALAAQRAKELADLAGGIGANRLNMTLSAYVLAARLEEVAEAASNRLRAMTQGRYTLLHSDASRGNARSGLRLLVSDAWTGQDRDTATLSGGETFLASLALALGLAEVVTASAGGAPLDALFVDEGFGTLDEDTLEEVLDVLDGLREGGRLVGIVSHVPHLRDRIPSRLRVHKGTSGSTLTQHGDLGDEVEAVLATRPGDGERPVTLLPASASSPAPPAAAPLTSAAPEELGPRRSASRSGEPPAAEQLALLGAD